MFFGAFATLGSSPLFVRLASLPVCPHVLVIIINIELKVDEYSTTNMAKSLLFDFIKFYDLKALQYALD